MKNVFFLFLLFVCFTACTGSNTETPAAPAKDSVTAAPVTLPYVAAYSSNFVPGKPADLATVLDNYKAWETGDMKALRATLGDSMELVFPSGSKMTGKSDSLMNMAVKFRDSLSKVELTLYAWISDHSVDKNEDWVIVWYKEKDTYKTGKIDSMYYVDDNRLVGGKIVYTSSYSQKIKK
jgi:ketosteroid isomerase-like protein